MADFKSLFCPSHPEEQVICLSKNPADKKLLFCIHCVLGAEPSVKNNLVAIKVAIEDVYKKLHGGEKIRIDESSIEHLLEVLDTRSQVISRFSEHIAMEKERVSNELDRLAEDLVKTINDTKAEINKKLDNQVETLKDYYAEFRQKLKKTTDGDKAAKKNTSLDDFYQELKNCGSSDAFEPYWRDILQDIKDNDMYSIYGSKAKRVLEDRLLEYKRAIDCSHKSRPKSLIASGKYYLSGRNEVTKMCKALLDRSSLLDSQLLKHADFLKSINLTGSLDSNVLQPHDLPLLEKISNKPIQTMSLIYRASKDGADFDSIKVSFNDEDVLMVIKTISGQVLGYRRSLVKESVLNGLQSSKLVPKGVTFSLTNQVAYPDVLEGQDKGKNGLNGGQAEWPSKYLRLSSSMGLMKDCGVMEMLLNLDGKSFFSEAVIPKEIEVYKLV